MKITYKKNVNDPPYPIMTGNTPSAEEFNKRSEALWKMGIMEEKVDNELITMILIEILIDDYDKRHAPRKRKK